MMVARLLILAAILAVAAVSIAIAALVKINQLSLPFPTFVPTCNIIIPIVTAAIWPVSRRLTATVKQNAIRFLLPYLASASSFTPLALFVLSLVYAVPSDMSQCAADRHWLSMFERKDARAISGIQNRLLCCGLNSMHDRAWPFPNRNTDARACEKTQGYQRACGNVWRNEEMTVAVLTAISSLVKWVFLVSYGLSIRYALLMYD